MVQAEFALQTIGIGTVSLLVQNPGEKLTGGNKCKSKAS